MNEVKLLWQSTVNLLYTNGVYIESKKNAANIGGDGDGANDNNNNYRYTKINNIPIENRQCFMYLI